MRASAAPTVPLAALDQLWFQVSGTVCNLRCRHCFISCSPDNHSFWFMTRQAVREALEESVALNGKALNGGSSSGEAAACDATDRAAANGTAPKGTTNGCKANGAANGDAPNGTATSLRRSNANPCSNANPGFHANPGSSVKEYYFTGGEPFMNREMVGILADALEYGPATVLTNATLLPERTVARLRALRETRAHPLELRVSIDGHSPETNDPIRGEGAFARAMEGVGNLVAAGFRPIITAMQSWPSEEMARTLQAFRDALAEVGYTDPRLKILPPLLIGEEAERNRGYQPCERVTHEMLHGYDLNRLLCSRARLVTASGVYACPILLDYPSARLADTLAEAVAIDAPLAEAACYTCYANGAICSNATTGLGEAEPGAKDECGEGGAGERVTSGCSEAESQICG